MFQPTLPLRGATAITFCCGYNTEFQPTLPLRGATRVAGRVDADHFRFNPRSPCGERPAPVVRRVSPFCFNPRSPCGERRDWLPLPGLVSCPFQPTLPLRGATKPECFTVAGDGFQPTLPLRGATLVRFDNSSAKKFQPTLPLRGATVRHGDMPASDIGFNPRSPCGERHPVKPTVKAKRTGFNPRSPCGERRVCSVGST